jgi:N-acetylglucosamine-6-phosphate deacetylase
MSNPGPTQIQEQTGRPPCPAGELCAWHCATREPVRLRWGEGTITAIEPVTESPPDLWLAPPLVDLQINGYAGIDLQQDGVPLSGLLTAMRGLRADGCTRWLLTLISDEWPKLMARLRHLRHLRAQSPELQQAIAGWHIEGPFLSSEPGFCGAHDPKVMCDPTPAHIEELRTTTGSDPVLLTLAPERSGAMEAIVRAASLGITVSLGHTNASQERLAQAVAAGAVAFTHLSNACPRLIDRHDNILWRVFETPGLRVSLIPDGAHVSGPLFRLIHRELGADAIFYVTDAMAAAGAPPGRYRLGRLDLEVGEDQVVGLPGSLNLAGSALTPIAGVFRAAEMLRCDWQNVWSRFSESPARLMGLESGLAPGAPADFCLVRVTPDHYFASLTLFVRGLEVALQGRREPAS